MDYSLVFGLLASLNVLLGGILVLRLKKYFNNILGFAGGVMIAIVLFEVLPELVHIHEELDISLYYGLGAMLFGVIFFHLLAFFLPLHEHGHHESDNHNHAHNNHLKHSLGVYGAIFMIVHSFIDGMGIGLGFQVSTGVGIAIAIAVMTHNFSDGINTVSTLLHSQANNFKFKFLFLANIFAPIAGVLISKAITVSEFYIYIYLGLFSGSILYLAISDILPQAHADKNKFAPILFTLLGVAFVIMLTQFLGGHGH